MMEAEYTTTDVRLCEYCGHAGKAGHPNETTPMEGVRYEACSVEFASVKAHTPCPPVFVRAPGNITVERVLANCEAIRVYGLTVEEMLIVIRELWREPEHVLPSAGAINGTANPNKRKRKHDDHDEAELARPIKRCRGHRYSWPWGEV